MALKAPVHLSFGVALLLIAAPIWSAPDTKVPPPVAHVGKIAISSADYAQAVQLGMRQRFYHGKTPPDQLEAFRQETLQQLIDRTLLLQEARRRKLTPDTQAITQRLEQYDQQYAGSAAWQQNRTTLLPLLRVKFEEESLLKRLEEGVKTTPTVTPQQVRTYYEAHPDKFTTPERIRLSLILLKLEPSSPGSAWRAAQDEAVTLVEKLRKGADFAALARLHSGDESAAQGGDMGYLHKGMVAKEAQQAIDNLQVGQIADPVMLLQGIAIFRLDERITAVLNPFERVQQRAGELLQREMKEEAWRGLAAKLRKQTTIAIDEKAVKALFTPQDTPAGE